MPNLQAFWSLSYSAGGGPLTQLFSQRLGAILAYAGERLSLTPNILTAFGLTCYIAAAGFYAFLPSGVLATLCCLLLYQLAYGLDCSDGQLARAHKRTSEFGAWLDVSADVVSHLFLCFGLLYWLSRSADGLQLALLLCLLPLIIGRVLLVYSLKFIRAPQGDGTARAGAGHTGKKMLWLLIDTPSFLLLISLLRDLPAALASYVVFMGTVYCLNAAYLGFTKLQRA